MNELASILTAWNGGGPDLADAVLATVVQVKGSAYRRPGARMLILADGTRLGTISGGCLESDVARKAAWWTSRGGAALRTFDTSSEQAAWEFGLGCNGVITVLLERLDTPAVAGQFRFLQSRLAVREESVVATVLRTTNEKLKTGDRLLWDRNGTAGGSLAGSPVGEALAVWAARTFADRQQRWVRVHDADVFVECVAPAPRLVIFGAGHDAIPLVAIARLMGWSAVVADGRSAYARPDRFPGAERVVTLPASGSLSTAGIEIDRETAVVMMTHNYPLDLVLLPQILERGPRYLGLLGPRRRSERLFAEAGFEGTDDRIHAPVGLDLGSDHPESIALAIAGEIQAVMSEREGGFLRHREGPIHTPTDHGEVDARNAGSAFAAERETEVVCETLASTAYA